MFGSQVECGAIQFFWKNYAGRMADDPDEIRVIENPYAFEPVPNPKYLVLGYLNEYMGRDTGAAQDAAAVITVTSSSPAERAEVVERFFPNENTSSRSSAMRLRNWVPLSASTSRSRSRVGNKVTRSFLARRQTGSSIGATRTLSTLGGVVASPFTKECSQLTPDCGCRHPIGSMHASRTCWVATAGSGTELSSSSLTPNTKWILLSASSSSSGVLGFSASG